MALLQRGTSLALGWLFMVLNSLLWRGLIIL